MTECKILPRVSGGDGVGFQGAAGHSHPADLWGNKALI